MRKDSRADKAAQSIRDGPWSDEYKRMWLEPPMRRAIFPEVIAKGIVYRWPSGVFRYANPEGIVELKEEQLQ